MEEITMQQIVAFCKSRGFVFPGSEIYGGFANTWDFGPLGVELKNNIKRAWWKTFVQEDASTYGVDAAILMNPRVWEASGHVQSFGDPKMDCKVCKQRFRADTIVENHSKNTVSAEAMTDEELEKYIEDNNVKCPNCGNKDWTKIRKFNPMFTTSRQMIGEGGASDVVYLRPETCQGEYINFQNVQRTMRAKVPFAIAQIGKSFRNEITPGNFLFRTVEFEQMELQKFCKEEESMDVYKDYKAKALDFVKNVIGINPEKLRYHDHDKLAHYAKAACDIQYKFPIGWQELNGIHHRGTWDLSRHQEYSGKTMLYTDPFTNEKILPNIVEYSIGADRLFLVTLCDAYNVEELEGGETRVVLKLKPQLAPFKVAVLPLQKNLNEKATEVFKLIQKEFNCDFDESGSIGKRYRRHDEIGTPFCVTIDFDTLEDNCVTVRDRDTMKQERIKIEDLKDYVLNKLN